MHLQRKEVQGQVMKELHFQAKEPDISLGGNKRSLKTSKQEAGMVWRHTPECMNTQLVLRDRDKQDVSAVVHFLKMSLRMHAQGRVFYRNASILELV